MISKKILLPGTSAEFKDAVHRMISAYKIFYQNLSDSGDKLTFFCWAGKNHQKIEMEYSEDNGAAHVQITINDATPHPTKKSESIADQSINVLEPRLRYYHANKGVMTPLAIQSSGFSLISLLTLLAAIAAIVYGIKIFLSI